MGVFYFPDRFINRFFTSGIIWMGLIVGMAGIIFSFAGRGLKLSGLILGVVGVLLLTWGYGLINGNLSWQQLLWGIILCLFMVIVNNSREWTKVWYVYFLLSLTGLFEALVGLGQYTGLLERYHQFCPVTGTFENPAGLAAYLTVCFAVVLYFLLYCSLWWKIWGWGIAFILFITVVLSGSRTGMIALGVIIIVALDGYFRIRQKIPKWIKVVGYIFGLGILLGLYWLKKDSADGRLLIWCCSGKMFCDAPIMGHGPSSFWAKYMDYQADWLTNHPGKWEWLADNVNHPFNEYVKIGVEYGSLGVLVVISFICGLCYLYRHCKLEERPLYWGLLGLGICAMFSYPFKYQLFVYYCFYFWEWSDAEKKDVITISVEV